jgi:hypothetical protein
MLNRLNYQFSDTLRKTDFAEELGELCLGFARAAFGSHEVSIQTKSQSTLIKKINASIVAIIGFALTAPISLPLTLIGAISLLASSSHSEKYAKYILKSMDVEETV